MNILVIEDEKINRVTLEDALTGAGHAVSSCETAEEGLKRARGNGFALAIVDFKLPGMDGFAFLQAAKKAAPHMETVLITAYGSIPLAVQAVKAGAYDFIPKPFSVEELLLKIERFFEWKRLREENLSLRHSLERTYSFENLVARAPAMQDVFKQAEIVAPSPSTVLLLGESGTGKELLAQAIHQRSGRSGSFIAVACGAIPETLMEAELFGYEKGSFTDARQSRMGKAEAADGGTLFLDDVDTLPPALQPKVLRFLQTQEVTRLGSAQGRRVNTRVIAAARPNLAQMVREGRFRDDLFYRLNVLVLHLPSLRDRREDIPLLVKHFIEKLRARVPTTVRGISGEAMKLLLGHDYPGNVRELEHLLERVMHFAAGPMIQPDDLASALEPGHGTRALVSPEDIDFTTLSYPAFLEHMERRLFHRALEKSGWNVSEAARLLDVPRTTLAEKIRKYDLRPDESRRS